MKYYRENQDIIAAEIEKRRLEEQLILLRTISEGRRKKAEWQQKVTEKIARPEVEPDYIEPAVRIIR